MGEKIEEKIKISILLGLYGDLLTDIQKKYTDIYFNEDLTLAEIGNNENVTRQAVSAILIKSKSKLLEYEEKLGFMQKEENIKELLKKLENGATEDQKKLIKKIGNELDI